ncbi:peroxidase [Ranunculus cassubicifolius]
MKLTVILCFVVLGFLTSIMGATEDGLMYDYYKRTTCPHVEIIIAKMMRDFVRQDFRVAPRIIRMHFHDCFVRGCDGSVLLNSTAENKAEKDARPNTSLKGYDVIDRIKDTLEDICPNTVSCADILAYAARESVQLTGKFPRYLVQGGRKDGRISRDIEVSRNIPPSSFNVSSLILNFASKGLSLEEMVTLSGIHSIGVSSCFSVGKRYSNFNNTGNPDPTLDSDLADSLRRQCDNGTTASKTVIMDTITPNVLDNKYYVGLLQNKGLFTSDATLLTDRQTLREVTSNANQARAWEMKFVDAMVKMGEIEVLIGEQGEVRKKCSIVN